SSRPEVVDHGRFRRNSIFTNVLPPKSALSRSNLQAAVLESREKSQSLSMFCRPAPASRARLQPATGSCNSPSFATPVNQKPGTGGTSLAAPPSCTQKHFSFGELL